MTESFLVKALFVSKTELPIKYSSHCSSYADVRVTDEVVIMRAFGVLTNDEVDEREVEVVVIASVQ